MAPKKRRIFFSQSPKRIATQFFFEKTNFSFSSFLQKNKKSSSGYAESSCDDPLKKFLVKTLKTLCSNSGNDENFGRIPNKVVSPQNVRLTCTMKIWQAWRNFVPKKTKNFPELQKCWSYNFLNKFISFIKNASLATENAILTTVLNTFLWESTHLQLRFRKPRKKTELFERKKTFLKIFLCTCKMQLWPPCRNFLVKTLKFFCWISRNEEKLISLPKKLFLKIFVWTCTTNFWQACRKAFFFEKSKLSFSSFLQKNKKSSSGYAESSCDDPVKKFLVKTLKTLCSISGNDENFGRIPNKVVSPQNVRLTCTMKIWQAWRNFVPKKRKTFPNSKNVEVTIFWTNLFFSSKMLL